MCSWQVPTQRAEGMTSLSSCNTSRERNGRRGIPGEEQQPVLPPRLGGQADGLLRQVEVRNLPSERTARFRRHLLVMLLVGVWIVFVGGECANGQHDADQSEESSC